MTAERNGAGEPQHPASRAARGCLFVSVLLVGSTGILALVAGSIRYEAARAKADAFSQFGSVGWLTPVGFGAMVARARTYGAVVLACTALLAIFRHRAAGQLTEMLTSLGPLISDAWNGFRKAIRVESRLHVAAAVTIVLISVALRLYYISQPMRHDEVYTFVSYARHPLYVVVAYFGTPNNHLLHTILVHFSYVLFGSQPWALRLPALLAGILLVPATYVAARVVYNKNVGLLAAALVASSSVLVEYSDNARGYTMVALFLVLVLALADRVRRTRIHAGWLLIGLLTALGIYTLPAMIYGCGAIAVWLLWSFWREYEGEQRRALIGGLLSSIVIAALISFVLYIPPAVTSGFRTQEGMSFRMCFSPLTDVRGQVPQFLAGVWQEWNRDIPTVVAVLLGAAVVASLAAHKRLTGSRMSLLLFVVIWCLGVMVAAGIVPRYRDWLLLLPLYLIWASAGLTLVLD